MKERLINQSTFTRYKLDQIPDLTYLECIDALQLLNYLFRRAENDETREELNRYIAQINVRVDELKQQPYFSADGEEDAEEKD